MRKIKTSTPLSFLLALITCSIVVVLEQSMGFKGYRGFGGVLVGLGIGLAYNLTVIPLRNWITKKKKEVSIWTGIAMIVFGFLFLIGSAVLFSK